jgi:hypothetical protein
MVVSGVVWTFWIAVFVTAAVFITIAALAVGYLVRVVQPKYPPGELRRRIDALIQQRR